MAKSLKEQLAGLVGGKKPNVFYKGLNTDIDEHLIGNDQYKDALNVRINNKDGDFGTLQNIRSTVSAGVTTLTGWKLLPKASGSKRWYYVNGHEDNDYDLISITFTFKDTTGATIIAETISCADAAFDWGLAHESNADNYSNTDILLHCYEVLKNDSGFTDKITVALAPPASKGDLPALYFFPVDQTKIAGAVTVSSNYNSADNNIVAGANTYELTTYASGGAGTFLIYPVGLVSFRDYIGAICFQASGVNIVAKLITSETGLITSIIPVVISDFGITSRTVSLKTVKIEENENYNRLYWTDGANPVKTVNIDASAGFYINFTESDDFNLFSKSPLKAVEIQSVTDTGNVNCGSWSYCYRLVTNDGKLSVPSPISNPLPLILSSKNTPYESSVGGDVSISSGKAVHLKIENIPEVYDKIQLIGIQYLDELGGAAFFMLKDETIFSDTMRLTHNGNETTTVITAAEVLSAKNTWDICQDIAVKDSRLIAANLRNNAAEVVSDADTFRVKSYKHDAVGSLANYSTAPPDTGSGYLTYTGLNNPDLYDETLYKESHQDTSHYRFAEGRVETTHLMFGASTPNYHGAGDRNGVYVTFKLKKFSLNYEQYWANVGGTNFDADMNDSDANSGHCLPPFFGPGSRQGEDGSWDNYKNPIFAQQYVGYMRDEIYRFGIQFYDKHGNQTFTYPIGDIRFPPIEADLRVLGTTPGDYSINGGSFMSTTAPNKYVMCDSLGQGWILYPEFRVKLHEDVRDKISGFNIVRAERTDADKRIVCAGLLNDCAFHADHADNGDLMNRIGLDKVSLFSPVTGFDTAGDYDFGEDGAIGENEFFTLDSPDAIFGKLSYTKTGTHELRIATKLKCKSYPKENKPDYAYDSSSQLTFDDDDSATPNIVTFMRGSDDVTTFFAAPIFPDYDKVPDLGDTRKLSFFSMYYCDDAAASDLAVASNNAAHKKTIFYGQNVGPNELVSASNYTTVHTQDFVNASLLYDKTDNWQYIDLDSGDDEYIKHDDGRIMHGNTTIFIALANGEWFGLNSGTATQFGEVSEILEGQNYQAAKVYGKIINVIDASSGIYGGNSAEAFSKTRWINTGAALHGDDISSTAGEEMILSVFGGDTYINMFSLNKFHRLEYPDDDTYRAVQGVVFPVESSINIDMRQGRYFGKDSAHLQMEDEYLVDMSYMSQNSAKSFPSRKLDQKLVTDFKNVIAVSNIKIAGQSEDAFSKFDAAEIFEVNANYGGIKNIEIFRDNLYAIQEKATSIISMNSRALIQSEDGNRIAIQSALGTGKVIERNDYVSTKYGSQHRMNTYATDFGLYWWDNFNSTICVVDLKNPKLVGDLLAMNGCSTFFTQTADSSLSLRSIAFKDSPLDVNNGGEGGISIAYNEYMNEVLFSFTYNASGTTKQVCIAYDESLGVFTSKRSYANILPVTHMGYLYSIGLENSEAFNDTSLGRRTIHIHDHPTSPNYNTFYSQLGDNPYVTFVNNEEVGTIKVFDKISISCSDPEHTGIFNTFAYATINDSGTLNLTTNDIDKVIVGKQIVPVWYSGGDRVKGNYLKVTMTQATNTATKAFNVFSVTTHYRKNMI